MTSKPKKGLRSSIDDALGDLLGDDDDEGPKVQLPAAVSSRPVAILTSCSGKRSLLDNDFFSKLAEEAEKDDENMDYMDTDLFGSKKKLSSAPVQRKDSKRTEPSKAGDKTKTTEETVPENKKPSSAPASTVRTYKKFSFLDDEGGGLDPPPDEDKADDSLDDLLDDLECKQKPTKKTEQLSSSLPAVPQKTEKASPAAAVKKREDLMFDEDEDEDDLMDPLGFGETHKTQGNRKTQKKDSD